jgi:peroxiredoxin
MAHPIMIRRTPLLVVIACAMAAAACQFAGGGPAPGADTASNQPQVSHDHGIRPVNSWAHYREILRSDGRSEAEIDADIAGSLADLRAMDRSAGNDRIGIAPTSFQFDAWLNSGPLSLEDLRGRVVLVRWWTDTCPFCASSAPALRALHEQYAARGLTLIGVFHPKAGVDGPIDVARVQRAVESRRFTFPVAIDWEWRTRTLRDWWLTGPQRPATSVTFILDKSGVIRFVHPGMEYHDDDGDEAHAMCVNDMASIRAAIERLIAE